MICIQIIIIFCHISLYPLHLHQSASLWSLGTISLNSSQIMLSLAYLYYLSSHIIPLSKSICWIRSGAAYKLKPGLSVEYFPLIFSYKYFLPIWSHSTLEVWDLTACYYHTLLDSSANEGLYRTSVFGFCSHMVRSCNTEIRILLILACLLCCRLLERPRLNWHS